MYNEMCIGCKRLSDTGCDKIKVRKDNMSAQYYKVKDKRCTNKKVRLFSYIKNSYRKR